MLPRRASLVRHVTRGAAPVALTLLGAACCAKLPASLELPANSAATSPAPVASGASSWAAVPPRRPSPGEFFFHPSLPLAGQQHLQDRCRVWDLDLDLYRGEIDLATCRAWHPASPAVPPALVAQTPDEPDTRRPAALLSAWSPDRKRIALGRADSRQVRLWDATTLTPLRTLDLPPTVRPGETDWRTPQLKGLAWKGQDELVVASFPAGVFFWSPDAPGSPVRPLPGDLLLADDVSADPVGRYLGYSFHETWQRGDGLFGAGVLLLASGKPLVEGRHDNWRGYELAADAPPLLSLGWSATGQAAYAVRQSDFATVPSDPHRVVLAALDVRHHRQQKLDVDLGKHELLVPSPDGAAFAWIVTTWDTFSGESTINGPSRTELSLRRWTLAGDLQTDWSVPRTGEVITWSPTSTALAIVDNAHVTVLDAATGKTRGTWPGHAPLAWSPAGDQLAYVTTDGALAVRRPGASAAKSLVPATHALAWTSDGTLAAATDSAVSLLAAGSWQPIRTIALPDVAALSFDAPHARWLLRDGQQRVHVDEGGKTELLTTTVGGATVQLTPEGDVLVVEPPREHRTARGTKVEPARVRRFARAASAWTEAPAVPLQDGESVDPSGQLAVAFRPEVTRLRRLSDGEVLNLDGPLAWTDRHAYEGLADKAREPWVFRQGDVLSGRLVQGPAAVALAPRVPDLWRAFLSGMALPGI